MHVKINTPQRRNTLATAIAATLGIAATGLPGLAVADIYTWGSLTGPASSTATCAASPNAAAVTFTMLTATGSALANTSITGKGANQFQTITCGTLTYNTATQSGTAEIGAFDFFSGTSPAIARAITIDKVPAGLDDGSGNLILANMLFDWSGNNGIPVSISWNAQGLLNEMDGTPTSFTLNPDGSINTSSALSGTGGTPSSDGTYSNSTFGYLALGPSPVATTDFNTTNVAGCSTSSCLGVNPSADINGLSAVPDTVVNQHRAAPGGYGTGTGIGGNPMQDGPFAGFNANFDFTSMKLVSFVDTTPPVINLNGVSPLSVTLGSGPYTDAGATCTDALPVGGSLTVTTGGDVVDTNVGGVYTITYDCTDGSSNVATQVTRTVVVASPGAPLVALNGSNPVTQECNVTPYTDAGALCVDFEDGAITGSIPPDVAGTSFSINQSAVDAGLGTPGSYTATWSCTDSTALTTAVGRTVNVVDTIKPVITINGASTVNIASSTPQNPVTYNDAGATATDSCDPSIGVTTTNPVDVVVPDNGNATLSYNVQYDAVDASMNSVSAFRTVNVTRSQPVITLQGSPTIVLKLNEPYVEPGIDITDAQDGNLTAVTTSGTTPGIGAGAGNLTHNIVIRDSSSNIISSIDSGIDGASYTISYDVTDSNGNTATQVTRKVNVGAFAINSNFTMLDGVGKVFGGTNDIVFLWDGTFNTTEHDTDFSKMSIATAKPQPFFNFFWKASHILVFGPGTYTFDTTCTITQIETGADCSSNPLPPNQSERNLTMTVKPGQVGAHIIFDWGKPDPSKHCGVANCDIDVLNVWDVNGVWDRHGKTGADNKLWDGQAGVAPDPKTTWKLVSTDINGDGVNGIPMVDGPFQGFRPNYNAGPGGTAGPTPPYTGSAPDTKLGNGLASLSLLSLFAGLTTLFGLRRFGKKRLGE